MNDEADQPRLQVRLTHLAAALNRRLDIVLLAVIAYVPALLSSPGRMPADTKLYLYTDPGGLLARAASTFEPDQFAGWVPHQQITYLWPSGPWYWLFDAIAVPDWIAHRLWIGTIFFAAGLGVRQCARLLGCSVPAALAAAVVYQCSPYVLPYVSRTSLLLLPWAGLGWVVAATIRATRPDVRSLSRLGRWREPALIGLIVATVGSTNATALAMIAPGPVLWVALATAQRRLSIREATLVVSRTVATCVVVSVWWVAMLMVQARSGAPVLLYSETLADVSRNASAPEIFRGMGYWLFYGRDVFAATTTSSLDYLTRSGAIAVSFVVALIGLAGIAFGRGDHRRFAALLAGVGIVLAVGVHPIGASSPLIRLITGDGETGLALALRSSTRAVPLLSLGLALGTAAVVERLPGRVAPAITRRGFAVRWPRLQWATTKRLTAVAIVLVAVVNMPSLWRAELVDPAIDRESDLPTAWNAAADALADQPNGSRVLQLPGAEFGAFTWGYTVDQPLVSATSQAVVTRDLLPLGAAPAMDLLYALDDRVQSGTLEQAAVAPLARLFGVGTIWIANDVETLRFRTPAAGAVSELLIDAPGLSASRPFGELSATPSTSTDIFGRPLVDGDLLGSTSTGGPRVELIDVEDPEAVIRVKNTEVIISGSGEGIVDAAAAGLIDGSEVLIAAHSIDEIAADTSVIVTDSNRDQARHWRSSQDVVGHTEPGGSNTDVLVDTAADQRLDPYGTLAVAAAQTIAVQRGPVTAIASDYGEPFAYRPEDRAVMAIDGDLATGWSVADHGDPIGASIRLASDEVIESLTLNQLAHRAGERSINAIDIVVEDRRQRVDLTPASWDGTGQVVPLDEPTIGPIDIVIVDVSVDTGLTRSAQSGVGFAEIGTGLEPTIEYIRPPIETLGQLAPDHERLDIVLTRARVEATSMWRSDPEPTLRRLLPLSAPASLEFSAMLRLDHRASDAELAELVGSEGAVADRRLPGIAHRGAAAVDGDDDTMWLTPVDDVVGARLTIDKVSEPISEIDLIQPVGFWSTITEIIVSGPSGENAATVSVPAPDANGRSQIELGSALSTAGAPLTITISGVEPALAIERRYGDTITLPAGIAELTGTTGIDAVGLADDRRIARTCDLAPVMVNGDAINVQFDTSVGALLSGEPVAAESCSGVIDLAAGEHTIVETHVEASLSVDRVVLSTPGQPAVVPRSGTADVLSAGARQHTVDVDCPSGCWLVLGMGHNDDWNATGPAGDLGPPAIVDGGFNGWWIDASTGKQQVTLTWTAQRPVTIGLVVSGSAVLGLIGIVILGGRRRPKRPTGEFDHDDGRSVSVRPRWIAPVVVGATVAMVVAPAWGIIALAVAAADALARSRGSAAPILALTGMLGAACVAVSVVLIERQNAPFPGAGWTDDFDHLHRLMLTAVALVAASAFTSRQPRSAGTNS